MGVEGEGWFRGEILGEVNELACGFACGFSPLESNGGTTRQCRFLFHSEGKKESIGGVCFFFAD